MEQTPVATWPFLIPLLAIGFAFVMGCKRRRHRVCERSSPVPEAPQPHHTSSRFLPGFLTGVLGSVLVVGVIIGVMRFGVNHGKVIPGEERVAPTVSSEEAAQILARIRSDEAGRTKPIPVAVREETPETRPAVESKSTSVGATEDPDDGEILNITLFEPGVKVGYPADELPEWTARTDAPDGVLPRVIRTGPHATVADAEAEALVLLALKLGETFVTKHPEAAGWTPPVALAHRIGAVGRRAIRESEVTVGEFTEPVYQAFWEVVPAANLDAQLFKVWRDDALQSRLLLVGGAIGLLTLLFGSLAGYFHVDAATRGKYRKRLLWGTAALWIAAGSALAIVA